MPIGTGLPIPKAGDELIQPPGIASGGDFGASSWHTIAAAGEQVAKAGLSTAELAVHQRKAQEKIGETAGIDLAARKTAIDMHAQYAATPTGPDPDTFYKKYEEEQAKYIAGLPTPEAQEHARKVFDQNKLNVYGALKNQQTSNTLNNANEALTAKTKMGAGDIVAAAQAGTLLDPKTGGYTEAGQKLIDEHRSVLQSAVTSGMKPQAWVDSQLEDTIGQGMGISLGRAASEKARAGDIQGAYDDIDALVNKNENLSMSANMRTKVVGQARAIVTAQAQAFKAELGDLKTRAQGAIEAYTASGVSSVPLEDHDATVQALRKHGDYHTADKLERSRGGADWRDGNMRGVVPSTQPASTRTPGATLPAPTPQAPVPSGKVGRQGAPIIQGAERYGTLPNLRARFGAEMAADPSLVNRFIAFTLAEPAKGRPDTPQAQLAFIESTLNRATDYQQSLSDTIPTTGRRTTPGQYFPDETHAAARRPPTQAEIDRIKPLIDQALAGSNTAKLATGNASADTGFGYGRGSLDPFTLRAAGERYGHEKANSEWVESMTKLLGPGEGVTVTPTVSVPSAPGGSPTGVIPGAVARPGVIDATYPAAPGTAGAGFLTPLPNTSLLPAGAGPAPNTPVPAVAPQTITDPTAAAAPGAAAPGAPAPTTAPAEAVTPPRPLLTPIAAAADARAQGYYNEREVYYRKEFPNLDNQIKNNRLTADSAAMWVDVAAHTRDVKFRDQIHGAIAAWHLNTAPELVDAQMRQQAIDNIIANAKNYPQDFASQLIDNLQGATADRAKLAREDPVTLHIQDGGNPPAMFGDFSDANQVKVAIQQHRIAAQGVATSTGGNVGDMLREPDKRAMIAAIQSKNPVRIQNAFDALTLMSNEELHATLNNNNEASKALKQTVIAQLRSTDGNAIASSGMALAALQQRDALAFDKIFTKEASDLVDAWAGQRALRSPEEIAALNAKMSEPSYVSSKAKIEDDAAKEFSKSYKINDVARHLGSYWFPNSTLPANVPDLLDKNLNNDQRAALLASVEREYVLMRTLGNDEAGAFAKAVERHARVWQVSDINEGRLMRWAPDKADESIYKKVNGSFNYQQDQLTQLIDLTKGQQPVAEGPSALGALRRIVTDANQKQVERERLAGLHGEPLPQAPTRITTAAPEGEIAGLDTPGNIDLTARPVVRTAEGKPATTRSITLEEKSTGKTVLLPTVIDEGNGRGKIVSNEEAIKHYDKTGQHLGIFNSKEDAHTYAAELSKAQAVYYKRQIEVPSDGQPFQFHSLYADPQTEREVAAWKANPNTAKPPSYKVFVTNQRTSQIELLTDNQGRETRIRFDPEGAQREAEMKARGLAPLTSLKDFFDYAAGPRYRRKLNVMEENAAQAGGPPQGTFPGGPETGQVPNLPDQAQTLPDVRKLAPNTTQIPPPRGFGGAGATNPPPGYAEGGHVEAGQEIVVGEKGKEKFVPDEPGTIVPNDQAFPKDEPHPDFMAGDQEGIKGPTEAKRPDVPPQQQAFDQAVFHDLKGQFPEKGDKEIQAMLDAVNSSMAKSRAHFFPKEAMAVNTGGWDAAFGPQGSAPASTNIEDIRDLSPEQTAEYMRRSDRPKSGSNVGRKPPSGRK